VSAPILRTKLHRPRLGSDLVARPRLLDALERGRDRVLTGVLVAGPRASRARYPWTRRAVRA
jgi:ATP/maltotriose-dependent transcriptional regulator MalT